MEPPGTLTVPSETHLLRSCCRAAERADIVARGLDGLRVALSETFHSHLIALAEEIRGSARQLRDLVDRSQLFILRVPLISNYLGVLLPCLSRSLGDITAHYDDKALSREIRWRKMYNKMTEEAGGLPLPQRFVLYNTFLSLLRELLTRYRASRLHPGMTTSPDALLSRSPSFDLNNLETLHTRILSLREKRGIRESPAAEFVCLPALTL